MAEQALTVAMFPKLEELRENRSYSEAAVKEILYGFARDLGCKWRKKRLMEYIETVFNSI